MYIRHILIVIVLFFAGKVQAQDSIPTGVLTGNWNIIKVVARTYSQQDRRLLQEKVLTSADTIRAVRGFVPTKITFLGHECTIRHSHGIESGIYLTDSNGHLWYKRRDKTPFSVEMVRSEQPWNYRVGTEKTLMIEMPPSYYNESGTNMPVKLVYTCYYEMAN